MSAIDTYQFDYDNSPALKGFAVTKHDTNELPYVTRALFVGVGGDVSVILRDDETAVLLKNVPSGAMLPLRVKQVKSTDTTATNMIGLY